MVSMKPSKHRCKCFPLESSSFLYGLRREAPSTQRVLLERLLNVLSRAAAQGSNNPQQLWAKTKTPDWWPAVTKLPWKNPRELPKDTKDTLKKKIAILERELTARGLMTAELKEELSIHRDSKKVDLELKSDFEAVMAKCSGLHFMVDKVRTKLGPSRVISDKTASYITDTKRCLENSLETINKMYQRVQAHEARRSSLWDSMGVSKQQRADTAGDLETDSVYLSPEDTHTDPSGDASAFVELYALASMASSLVSSPFSSPVVSPLTVISPTSPPPDMSDHAMADMLQEADHSPLTPTESLERNYIVPFQRSLSQPTSPVTMTAPVQVLDLSQGKSVSVSVLPSLTKRSWDYSTEAAPDHESLPVQVKSRKLEQPLMMESLTETADTEDDEVQITGFSPSLVFLPSSASQGDAGTGSNRQTADNDVEGRGDLVGKRRPRHHRPRTVGGTDRQSQLSFTEATSRRSLSLPVSGASFQHCLTSPGSRIVEWRGTAAPSPSTSTTSTPFSPALTVTSLTSDVTVDGGEAAMDRVEEILEDRRMPTLTMYCTTDELQMEQLTAMTVALSCEDLSPSVTEPVVDDLPFLSVTSVEGGSGKDHQGHAELSGPTVSRHTASSGGGRSRGVVSTATSVSIISEGGASSVMCVPYSCEGGAGSVMIGPYSSGGGAGSVVIGPYSSGGVSMGVARDCVWSGQAAAVMDRSGGLTSSRGRVSGRGSDDSLSKAIGGLSNVL